MPRQEEEAWRLRPTLELALVADSSCCCCCCGTGTPLGLALTAGTAVRGSGHEDKLAPDDDGVQAMALA